MTCQVCVHFWKGFVKIPTTVGQRFDQRLGILSKEDTSGNSTEDERYIKITVGDVKGDKDIGRAASAPCIEFGKSACL
jgi:hypothetical protein